MGQIVTAVTGPDEQPRGPIRTRHRHNRPLLAVNPRREVLKVQLDPSPFAPAVPQREGLKQGSALRATIGNRAGLFARRDELDERLSPGRSPASLPHCPG